VNLITEVVQECGAVLYACIRIPQNIEIDKSTHAKCYGGMRGDEGNRRNGGSGVLCPSGGVVERTGERGIRDVDC